MYQYGKGVKQDYRTAIKWYKAAIQRGNDQAMDAVSAMYKAGQIKPQEYMESYQLYPDKAED